MVHCIKAPSDKSKSHPLPLPVVLQNWDFGFLFRGFYLTLIRTGHIKTPPKCHFGSGLVYSIQCKVCSVQCTGYIIDRVYFPVQYGFSRGTVQKSVCVLSRLPLYGQIQVQCARFTVYCEWGKVYCPKYTLHLMKYIRDEVYCALCKVYYRVHTMMYTYLTCQVKMSLITQAYFEEGDFSNVSLIKVN